MTIARAICNFQGRLAATTEGASDMLPSNSAIRLWHCLISYLAYAKRGSRSVYHAPDRLDLRGRSTPKLFRISGGDAGNSPDLSPCIYTLVDGIFESSPSQLI